MPETISGAPLLLALIMGNNNMNATARWNTDHPEDQKEFVHWQEYPVPDTITIHETIAEVDIPQSNKYDNNGQNGAIPGTIGAHDEVTEVENLQNQTVGIHDNNNRNGAIPGTVGMHDQVTQLQYLHGKVDEAGTLYLRADSQPPQVLTQGQCESYYKNGYLVLPDNLTADEADAMLSEARNLMGRVSKGGEGIIRHDITTSDATVPSPIDRILATFEPEDETISNPFQRRIARLGCGMHKIPAFGNFTHSGFNRSVARSLGYSDARITQGQIIAKLAGVGGEIVPHHDGCVSFTDSPSALTFWYALEDTTIENGCLCVAGGSHLTSPLRQRLVKSDNRTPKFEDLAAPLWARETRDLEIEADPKDFEYQNLEVKKGTLVLFHGNLMHKSAANRSERDRIAYTFSIVEGQCECPEDSYLKPEVGNFDSL